MNNQSPGVDVMALHDAIEQTIAAGQIGLNVVPAYSRVEGEAKAIPSPACFIMLSDADLQGGSSTDQTPAKLNFLAFVVVRFTAQRERAHREVRQLATNLGVFLRGKRFGQPVQAASVGIVGPADMEPDEDGYETWQVPFSVECMLGISTFDFDNTGVTPSDVRASYEPLTGVPHEPDYVQVATPPAT